jgi:hypothetical protein
MKYIVSVKLESQFGLGISVYIKKVVSYKRNIFKCDLNIDNAHRYFLEENAIKASNAFNGEVKVI